MLTVHIPETCRSEIEYVLGVVFTEWLGVPFRVVVGAYEGIEIEREGGVLSLDASFFRGAAGAWLEDASMPVLPLGTLGLADVPAEIVRRLRERVAEQPGVIPVLYGEPRVAIPGVGGDGAEQGGRRVRCDVDIFGSIFFMLSRYEEVVVLDRDEHDRFPATASVAFKAGFLDRPIVNEYVELLWAMISYLWPGLERKSRGFRTLLSHDVDIPFAYAGMSLKRVLRRMAGDILKRAALPDSIRRWKTWSAAQRGDVSADPLNTFDFIMRESERRGLASAFYFIADHSAGAIDGNYTLDDPEIVQLLRVMLSRGHEIGLHTSYNTYRDPQQTAREAENLRRALRRHGLAGRVKGGRQHFLRWATPQTLRNWDAAGMEYDTTLGFADHVGFRAGTCWEYPTYDVMDRRALELRERPLVAMEVSVIKRKYMAMGYGEQALETFAKLKDVCRMYRGDFTLLWHNDKLATSESRALYCSVLDH